MKREDEEEEPYFQIIKRMKNGKCCVIKRAAIDRKEWLL